MKPRTLALIAAALVAYRIVFDAWPGEDFYRMRNGGRGYFE